MIFCVPFTNEYPIYRNIWKDENAFCRRCANFTFIASSSYRRIQCEHLWWIGGGSSGSGVCFLWIWDTHTHHHYYIEYIDKKCKLIFSKRLNGHVNASTSEQKNTIQWNSTRDMCVNSKCAIGAEYWIRVFIRQSTQKNHHPNWYARFPCDTHMVLHFYINIIIICHRRHCRSHRAVAVLLCRKSKQIILHIIFISIPSPLHVLHHARWDKLIKNAFHSFFSYHSLSITPSKRKSARRRTVHSWNT